MYWYKIYIG